jgi:hypothetical protein
MRVLDLPRFAPRIVLAALAVALLPVPSFAQVGRQVETFVYNGTTITFSTPETRSECTASGMTDEVFTTGVPSTWVVRGQINVGHMTLVGGNPTFVITQVIPVNQTNPQGGNIFVEIQYPPLSSIPDNAEGNKEYHVEPQLEVIVNGQFVLTLGPGQDWDVFCSEDPPPPPPPGPFAGCTPGYWKQTQHFDSWPAGVQPATSFESVFGPIPGDSPSFLDALQGGGGSGLEGALKILRRAAAAAYLNAAQPDNLLNYGYDPTFLVFVVNQVANSGDRNLILQVAAAIDDLNNRGCTLN